MNAPGVVKKEDAEQSGPALVLVERAEARFKLWPIDPSRELVQRLAEHQA